MLGGEPQVVTCPARRLGAAVACPPPPGSLCVVLPERFPQLSRIVARDSHERIAQRDSQPDAFPAIDRVGIFPVPAKIIKHGLRVAVEHLAFSLAAGPGPGMPDLITEYT